MLLLLLQIHAVTGDLLTRSKVGVLPILFGSIADPLDIFIMNFGLWHHTHSRDGYKTTLHQLGTFYNDTKGEFPYQFFMETPKQHFSSENGDWAKQWFTALKDQGNLTCKPIAGVTMNAQGELIAERGNALAMEVAAGGWRNADARKVLRDTYGMTFVPVYNATVPAWEMHRQNAAGQECSHYCHPSMPQLWVYMFYRTLQNVGVRQFTAEEAAKRASLKSCVVMRPGYHEAKFNAGRTKPQGVV